MGWVKFRYGGFRFGTAWHGRSGVVYLDGLWRAKMGCGKAGRICSVKVVYVKFCWVPVRQVRCVAAS